MMIKNTILYDPIPSNFMTKATIEGLHSPNVSQGTADPWSFQNQRFIHVYIA